MLTGNLVRLRPIELADKERFYTWINDPEVKRFLEARSFFSMVQEEEFIKQATTQTRPPLVHHAIDTLVGAKHIGSINLHAFSMEDRHATLGIMIGEKSYWRNGYGTDAITTLLRYGFEELNLIRIDLQVMALNERAIACYRKCGFILEGRLRQHRFAHGRYSDLLIMSILIEEFYALHGQTEIAT